MSIPVLLAGDIGGTRTRLGLFENGGARPRRLDFREFSTTDFEHLQAIIATYLADARDVRLRAACFGVAGPVSGNAATLTNVPWRVEGDALASHLGVPVRILNDLQAMAYGVPVLKAEELHCLQAGTHHPEGNMAAIAAGTGLGEALLHNINGRMIPSPSESGHADFAARNEREFALVLDLTRRYGRATVERVLSGPGLVNIHRITHVTPCRVLDSTEDPDAPAIIGKAALTNMCQGCVAALGMFVEAYGAEAGNLALRSLATGGIFIGGGIGRRILPAMTDGRFMRAFREKAPFEDLMSSIPVNIILNEGTGLVGAAVVAERLARADA